MIVKDFTADGGNKCASCHQEPLVTMRCLCERWYCEDHFDRHYGKCPAVLERTTPKPLREP